MNNQVVSYAMTASNEQTSLVVKPKQNEYVSFDIYYLRPSHILKQFNNSGYLGMLLFIQLATGTAYLAESATQMAGCWNIGGTLKEPHTFCMIWTPSSPGHTLLCPNNSMYRQPRAYTSTAGPLCAVLNISGAMYRNVPMSQIRTSCRSSLTYE